MPSWNIEAEGVALEHYSVDAETEEEARAMFERGDAGDPSYTEVSDSEIKKIKEERV